ncbi:hypothetical protein CSB37_02780 [bacterium DOLZORAL124_38_8]|nr:MAG: hypothetical protein CSB37_02780 [bacterium DOLZORAL124_38_8]
MSKEKENIKAFFYPTGGDRKKIDEVVSFFRRNSFEIVNYVSGENISGGKDVLPQPGSLLHHLVSEYPRLKKSHGVLIYPAMGTKKGKRISLATLYSENKYTGTKFSGDPNLVCAIKEFDAIKLKLESWGVLV